MANFRYSGRNSSGALVAGTMTAGSSDEVVAVLQKDHIIPIDIARVNREENNVSRPSRANAVARRRRTSQKTDSGDVWETFKAFLNIAPVSLDELIIFSRQMFSLIKAGLPLNKALKGLETSVTNLAFKKVLADILVSLENGLDLATSLGRHPEVFPHLFVSLVHVGENTGRLDEAFEEVSRYLALEQKTRKLVKKATRYPLFVLASLVIAVGVITVFVIPIFASTFERLGANLPWQTQLLISVSDFVVGYWPLLLMALGFGVWAFQRVVKTIDGRLLWDKRKLHLPLAGPILERVALGRFARTFSMVMGSGVPIVQGLTIVSGAVGNAYVASQVRSMREGVERGESLYLTAAASGMFTPLVLQMISVGEETGTIDELLGEVAEFYDSEIEYQVESLGDAIEPILISLMGILVLIMALGVFLPIWDLNTAVQG